MNLKDCNIPAWTKLLEELSDSYKKSATAAMDSELERYKQALEAIGEMDAKMVDVVQGFIDSRAEVFMATLPANAIAFGNDSERVSVDFSVNGHYVALGRSASGKGLNGARVVVSIWPRRTTEEQQAAREAEEIRQRRRTSAPGATVHKMGGDER